MTFYAVVLLMAISYWLKASGCKHLYTIFLKDLPMLCLRQKLVASGSFYTSQILIACLSEAILSFVSFPVGINSCAT